MKSRLSHQRNRAFTALELVVIIGVLAVLSFMLLSTLASATNAMRRVDCVNNLKQIGLAYRLWGTDHFHQYPMAASATNDDAVQSLSEGVPIPQLCYWNYLTLSNQLATPKLLHCPADAVRPMAIRFDTSFSKMNISYFANPDAAQSHPQAILSGDDNLAIDHVPVKSGLLELSTNTSIAWTRERHHRAGNIGFADGSVQQVDTIGLHQALQKSGTSTNRFLIP